MGNKVPMVPAITSEELLVRNILGPSYYYLVFASFTGDLSRVPATTFQRYLVRSLGLALLLFRYFLSSAGFPEMHLS